MLNFGTETVESQTNIFETTLQENVSESKILHIASTIKKNEVSREEKDWLDFEELLNVVMY